MTLTELQTGLRDWLTDSATRHLPMGLHRGLDIYQNNYRSQLVGCLQESYPQLRSWLGDDAFLCAARTHIERHRPTGWTLDAYGANFGATVQALFPDNPDLHELAWIEAALASAFVAPDAPPLAASALPFIDWDLARLRFTPSLSLALASTNAADIWWAMHDQTGRPESRMLARPGGVMAWRRGYVSCLRTLDRLDFAALAHACADGSFTSLCDMLVAQLGETDGVAKAGSLLAEWIGSELITSIDDQGAFQHA